MKDGKERFSNRAAVYARHRPGYPAQMLSFLREACGLSGDSVVADVGSGTGILAGLFLESGNRVFGVEPNAEMRAFAERLLGRRPLFESVAGSAEETTLPDGSVDLVAVGNALHWIDVDLARGEFSRILKPGGRVAVAWNMIRSSGDAFHEAFQGFVLDHSTEKSARTRGDLRQHIVERTEDLFEAGDYETAHYSDEHSLDLQSLKGLAHSISVLPAEGEPGSAAMLRDLETIFHANESNGRVTVKYVARIHCGHLDREG